MSCDALRSREETRDSERGVERRRKEDGFVMAMPLHMGQTPISTEVQSSAHPLRADPWSCALCLSSASLSMFFKRPQHCLSSLCCGQGRERCSVVMYKTWSCVKVCTCVYVELITLREMGACVYLYTSGHCRSWGCLLLLCLGAHTRAATQRGCFAVLLHKSGVFYSPKLPAP